MEARSLRTLLLVKAVEEQDAAGALLPVADREAATRNALRAHSDAMQATSSERDFRLAHAQRVAVTRADELYAKLVERHPVIERTVLLESRLLRYSWWLLGAAFLLGLVLSVVDSRVRIDIVAFPLIGLVAWNLLVYSILAVRFLRRLRPAQVAGVRASVGSSVTPGWVGSAAQWGWRRAAKLIEGTEFYHRPLAAALREFSAQWWVIAQPALAQQAQRLYHFASATVAIGLVAGFYVRGIGLEYRAGWESTFLGASAVRAIVHVLYGPAALLTGIALPATSAQIEALHWRDGAGGGPAAIWIHLMAATALLVVIVPRVLLGLAAALNSWRVSRSVALPDSAVPYLRQLFAASDAALPADTVRLIAYAYAPPDTSLRGAENFVRGVFGPDARITIAPPVPYGEEASLTQLSAPREADVDVLLLSLAATPESENHGAAMATLRDRTRRSKAGGGLLLLVDEAPFLQRMGSDAALASRVEERRQAWRDFASAYGLRACLVDLGACAQGGASIAAPLRDATRNALLRSPS